MSYPNLTAREHYCRLKQIHAMGYVPMVVGISLVVYSILFHSSGWSADSFLTTGRIIACCGIVSICVAIYIFDGDRSGLNYYARWLKIGYQIERFPMTAKDRQESAMREWAANQLTSQMRAYLAYEDTLRDTATELAAWRREVSWFKAKPLRYRVVAVGTLTQQALDGAKLMHKLFRRLNLIEVSFDKFRDEVRQSMA